MSRKCEMIVGHGCNAEGDLTHDIECTRPAAELVGGTAMCAECIAYQLKHDPEIITLETREPIVQGGGSDVA